MRPVAGRWLLIASGLSFLLATGNQQLVPAFAETVEAVDADKDGKPEEWRYSEGGVLVRVERDLDRDGKAEVRITFKEGKPEHSEVDRNGDGKPDLVYFYETGKPARMQADLNFDGKPDAWSYYKEGVKDFMIMDKNYDGQPDAWFYYGQGGLKLIGGKVDEDFDGKTDRSFGAFPKEENREPW